MRLALFILLTVAVCLTGCRGSRWAKRDADYRRKYPEHTDDPLKTVKQAVDARHVAGKHGAYVSFAGRDEPFAGGFDIGGFRYTEPWLEQRIGLSGLLHEEGKRPVSLGLLTSMRAQVPSRLAPFAGVGAYAGWAGGEQREYTIFDEEEEAIAAAIFDTKHEFVVAAFPEVGMHFWIDHRRRLTTSVSYWFTNQDRGEDFLFFSVGFSWFSSNYQDYSNYSDGEFNERLGEFRLPPPPPPGTTEETVVPSPYSNLDVAVPEGVLQPPETYPSTGVPPLEQAAFSSADE
ncbi:hypothetical protein NG895_08555 [Aeoliella sp. ICT_H6.2]|uniref:Uncharacterized protein n=1 Tax=Aeoliella straminimaris TaxID=2954799 RepID=A0A9X2FDN2_9BACT|nr:hypothetical protein [Aeoliella straminimaris]MCO6043956.1 hypothetical protein [Aeoliella straminimaris]